MTARVRELDPDDPSGVPLHRTLGYRTADELPVVPLG